uniref:SFRICE_023076 n=1 Tax=Spodoptera frugiperda TaxID=7108 RepID=A0A2H1X068_SPOFR
MAERIRIKFVSWVDFGLEKHIDDFTRAKPLAEASGLEIEELLGNRGLGSLFPNPRFPNNFVVVFQTTQTLVYVGFLWYHSVRAGPFVPKHGSPTLNTEDELQTPSPLGTFVERHVSLETSVIVIDIVDCATRNSFNNVAAMSSYDPTDHLMVSNRHRPWTFEIRRGVTSALPVFWGKPDELRFATTDVPCFPACLLIFFLNFLCYKPHGTRDLSNECKTVEIGSLGRGFNWASCNLNHTTQVVSRWFSVRPWYHFVRAGPFVPKHGPDKPELLNL